MLSIISYKAKRVFPLGTQAAAGSTANTCTGTLKFCIRSTWVTAFLLQSKLFAKLASGARGPVALKRFFNKKNVFHYSMATSAEMSLSSVLLNQNCPISG